MVTEWTPRGAGLLEWQPGAERLLVCGLVASHVRATLCHFSVLETVKTLGEA